MEHARIKSNKRVPDPLQKQRRFSDEGPVLQHAVGRGFNRFSVSTPGNLNPENKENLAHEPSAEAALQRVWNAPMKHALSTDVIVLQRTIGNRAVQRLIQQKVAQERSEDGEMVRESTGLPSQLKAGLEQLSGMDLSDVKVHRNSPNPAGVGALAYTQGNDIHVAEGEETHLPHEGWHVVQQREGRVTPTAKVAGYPLNDDATLENEADRMGEAALETGNRINSALGLSNEKANRASVISLKPAAERVVNPVQAVSERMDADESENDNALDEPDVSGALLSGNPLPDPHKRLQETRFGTKFDDVRLHSRNTAADNMAVRQNVPAVTVGKDVYVKPEVLDLDAPVVQGVLSHELTHVVQQRTAPSAPWLKDAPPANNTVLEREARAVSTSDENSPVSVQGQASHQGPQALGWEDVTGFLGGVAEAGGEAWDVAKGAVVAGIETVKETIAQLVARLAPELLGLLQGGLKERIGNLLLKGLDALIGATMGDLGSIDIVSSLSNILTSVNGAIDEFTGSIATSIGDAVNAMMPSIISAIDRFGMPMLKKIQAITKRVSAIFDTVSNIVLKPLAELGGAVWEKITSLANWIWDLTAPVRNAISSAWEWVKKKFNLAWDSSAGAREWLAEKAKGIWEAIQEKVKPILGPLKKVISVLVAISPAGPLIAIYKYGGPVWEKLKWIWNNWKSEDILITGREYLEKVVLPGIISGVQSLSGALSAGATWLASQTAELTGVFSAFFTEAQAQQALQKTNQILRNISNQFQRLSEWAETGVAETVQKLVGMFKKVGAFLGKVLNLLFLIGKVILNPLSLPLVVMNEIWKLIEYKYKARLVDFLLEVLITFVGAMPTFMPGLGFLAALVKTAVMSVFETIKGQDTKTKVTFANRMAMLLSGGSLQFVGGFLVGLLKGLWEGLTDPFVLIGLIAQLVYKAAVWVYEKGSAFIAGLLNKGDTAKAATETGGVTADAKAAQTAAEGLSGADAELADEQVKNQEKADASPKDIFALIGDAMDAIMAGAAALGAKIAEALIGFFTLDDYAMGDKVGWLAGTILFEVALAYFTGGTYAALIESKPFLKYLVKLLDLGGEIIGAIGRLLKSIKGPLMAGVKSFGKLAGKIPILNTIIEKIAAALKAVFKFFDSKAGREAVEGTAEKLGKETAEEAAEKTAKNVTEEGVEKATKETAEEAAEKGKKLDDLETGKKPTPDELAEKPAALAEAKGMAEINDALDLPVAVTIAALSSLKARYKWIKSFEAKPKPIPGHYEIHMIASDSVVDKDYSDTKKKVTIESVGVKVDNGRFAPETIEDWKKLKETLPSRPSGLSEADESLWEQYLEYYKKRVDEGVAGTTTKGPLTPDAYIDLQKRYQSGLEFQKDIFKEVESERPGLDMQSNLGVKKGDETTKYVDYFGVEKDKLNAWKELSETDKLKKVPEVESFSVKQRGFEDASTIKAQVEADVEEAFGKYGDVIEIRRPNHPLFGYQAKVKKVTLIYDGTSLSSATREEIEKVAKLAAKGRPFEILFRTVK